mgnify:CR=1 FL=1
MEHGYLGTLRMFSHIFFPQDWNPQALREHYGASIVEVFRLIEERFLLCTAHGRPFFIASWPGACTRLAHSIDSSNIRNLLNMVFLPFWSSRCVQATPLKACVRNFSVMWKPFSIWKHIFSGLFCGDRKKPAISIMCTCVNHKFPYLTSLIYTSLFLYMHIYNSIGKFHHVCICFLVFFS